MQERWREILEFPGYSVSDTGYVKNDKTDRLMAAHVNQHGIVNVGFNLNGIRFKRSVTVLVATAFVTTARSLEFDTPINLDGDRLNNCAWNLLWRPLWYARKYFQQFHFEHQGFDQPVRELKTKEVFHSSWDAATTFGLLEVEVVHSIANRTYARPTYQMFELVN